MDPGQLISFHTKRDISRFSKTRVNLIYTRVIPSITPLESNSLDQDLAPFVGPDLVPKLFAKVINRQQLQAKGQLHHESQNAG